MSKPRARGGGCTEQYRSVLERHIAAFNAKEPDQYPWTEDVEFVAPGAGVLRGREEVLGFLRVFWQAFPDAHIETARVIWQGSRAAALGRFSGSHTGPLSTPAGEVAPTGREVTFGWMAMCEFAGDKLAEEHLCFDQAEPSVSSARSGRLTAYASRRPSGQPVALDVQMGDRPRNRWAGQRRLKASPVRRRA